MHSTCHHCCPGAASRPSSLAVGTPCHISFRVPTHTMHEKRKPVPVLI